MKVLLESTSTIVTLKTPDGSMPCRLWEGITPEGVGVHAYMVRVYANRMDDIPLISGEQVVHRDPSPQIVNLVVERHGDEVDA